MLYKCTTNIKIWLGEFSDSGVSILRLTILSLPFYTFSGLTRSPIDAISEKGYNSLIYGFAAVSMILLIILGNYYGVELLITALYSFLFSHILAGLLSAYYIQKLFKHWFFGFKLFRDIILSILIMIIISQIISMFNIALLSQLFISSTLFLLIALMIFKYTKTGWVAEVKSKLYAK